ncbi:MAG TPA: hypothetical protein DHW82_14190 [Spirochaetia bacterium]|nr:hypothetical protein [Spirochaetia bacterium]
MKEIKIIEKEGIQTVNARELWGELEVKTEYSHWIKKRLEESLSEQGIDYIVFHNSVNNENQLFNQNIDYPHAKKNERFNQSFKQKIDYYLTIEKAKEICMLERTEKGREVRKYLDSLSQKENKAVKIFENIEFGKVATVLINDLPYFKLVDVCNILDLENSREVRRRLDSEGVIIIDGGLNNDLGGNINTKTTFISESNLYDVILDSRKPEAKKFRKWIINEVIPSIRKDGAYLTDNKIDEILTNPDTIIKLAMQVKESRQREKALEHKIEEDKPKVEFYEAVAENKGLISVQEFAKLVGIGSNTLFQILRKEKILFHQDGRNLPFQKYLNAGYFKIREEFFEKQGERQLYIRVYITGKGQGWLRRLLFEKKCLATA